MKNSEDKNTVQPMIIAVLYFCLIFPDSFCAILKLGYNILQKVIYRADPNPYPNF